MKKIENNVAKKRLTEFQKTAEEIKLDYRKNLFNNYSSVLFENRIAEKNEFFGRDEYFNSVIVKSNNELKVKITKKVKIINGNQNTLFGEISQKMIKKDFAA